MSDATETKSVSRQKYGITQYGNGVLCRLHNRRIILIDEIKTDSGKPGVHVTFHNAVDKKIRTTHIALTHEAMQALISMYLLNEKNKKERKCSKN